MATLSPSGMGTDVTATAEGEVKRASSTCDTLCAEKIRALVGKSVDSPKAVYGRYLGPVTPVPERGSAEAFVGSSTPLTCISKPMVEICDETEAQAPKSDDVHTPKTYIFNPFAAGPDKLVFAPRKQGLEEFRSLPVRRLKFDSDSDSSGDVGEDDCKDVNHDKHFLDVMYESFLDGIVTNETQGTGAQNLPLDVGEDDCKDVNDDKHFLDVMYESFLDRIVTNETEGTGSGNLPLGLDFSNSFKTPTSSPLLTGIIDTCPAAPMKPVGVARNLKLGICRKLEF